MTCYVCGKKIEGTYVYSQSEPIRAYHTSCLREQKRENASVAEIQVDALFGGFDFERWKEEPVKIR